MRHWHHHNSHTAALPPLYEYSLLVHPPLVIENLLPHAGAFELADAGVCSFGDATAVACIVCES